MARWDAPSDVDATDEPWANKGVERTCSGCGEPVFVASTEPYQVQVFCDRCQVREPETYRCAVCNVKFRPLAAMDHSAQTGHAIRYRGRLVTHRRGA